MPISIKVQTDIKKLTKKLGILDPKVVRKATSSALNKTGSTIRAKAKRRIARLTGIKQAALNTKKIGGKPGIWFDKARSNKLVAEVGARGGARNLVHFAARATRAGISAAAWGRRKIYRGTFLANQGRTVFKRTGKARLPIEPVWGPSISRTWLNAKLTAVYKRVARRRFSEVFPRELRFFANKASR